MNSFAAYVAKPPGDQLLYKWQYLTPDQEVDCPLCGCPRRRLWYSLGQARAMICRDCGFKYISPRLSGEKISDYYASMYKDEIFKTDFEGRRHDVFGDEKERAAKIKDRHIEIELTNQLPQGSRVLDIGCGAGLYFEGLKSGLELHGLELSPKAASYCKEKFQAEIKNQSVEEADYPSGYFDVINLTYVIEHLLDPKEVLARLRGWLKDGGVVLISSPNWGSPLAKLYREFFRLNDPCQHINLWDPPRMASFLAQQGFTEISTRFPYFKTEYFNRYEVKRLLRNTLVKLALPLLLAGRYRPPLEKLLSPPFWGNIMVVRARKES